MTRNLHIFVRWQNRRLSRVGRGVRIALAPVLFVLLFVLAPTWWAAERIDLPIGLPAGIAGGLGLGLGLAGAALYLWTIVLFARARGTQVPMAPTQRLVTTGPYAVSRNPMVTGAIGMSVGAGVLADSWASVGAGLVIPILYLVYVARIEEQELALRFGADYVAYRERTPFLLPRLPRRLPAIIVAAWLAVASSVRAQPPPVAPPREPDRSLLVGVSLGAGVMKPADCDGCDAAGGLAVDAAFGVFFTRRLAVVGDLFAVVSEQGGITFASGVTTLAVQYWVMPALWLRGGAGVARLQVSDGPGADSALGFSAAIGHELMREGGFRLDARARFAHGTYEIGGVSSLALMVAGSWYWP